ncbi:unnamed protein product [Lathyrus oleraceus]
MPCNSGEMPTPILYLEVLA